MDPRRPGQYKAQDRKGVVHFCFDDGFRHEDRYMVDMTLCGGQDYLRRTDELVTCIQCLAVEAVDVD